MAEFKVDNVRYYHSEATGKLIVWVFNDLSYYAPKARKLAAQYDFGRKPTDENGNPADKKVKLIVGLYREPYRDGWKYTLNSKVHPKMANTVLEYIHYGWEKDENGELVPFTYLRHNRKALGIHYLFQRYYDFYLEAQKWNARHPVSPMNYKTDMVDFICEPYFPTPNDYEGYNVSRYK